MPKIDFLGDLVATLGAKTTPKGDPIGLVLGDVPEGYVRLVTAKGEQPAGIDLYATSQAVMLPDGYGEGWTTQDRPGRVDATVWTSGKPLRQQVDVLLDRLYQGGGDVEKDWNTLERLARPPRGARPPRLKLVGPWLHKDLEWVLSIEPSTDEELWVWEAGRLVRAAATLTLMQHVTVDLTDRVTKKDARPQRTTKVRQGESIKAVSKRIFKTTRRARDIADLNGIKSVLRKPKAGTVLRLPAS